MPEDLPAIAVVLGVDLAMASTEHALDDLYMLMSSERTLDEAMSKYGRSRISLVVVDQDATPDVIPIIKRVELELPDIGIVIVSSNRAFSNIVRTYAAGAHLHLSRDAVADVLGPWFARWRYQPLTGADLLRGDVSAAIRPARDVAARHAVESIVEALKESAVDTEFDVSALLTDAIKRLPATRDGADLTENALRVMETRAFDRYEGGDLVGGATAEAEPSGDVSLHWNSRFPGNEAALARWPDEPGRILSGTTYRFETALETTPGAGATSLIRNPERLIGTEVVFGLKGTGGKFTLDREPDVAHEVVRSEPIAVTATGTSPFAMSFRSDRGGRAVIEADLLVRGARIATQRIELRVIGDQKPPALEAAPNAGSHRPGPIDTDAMATTIPVDIGLTLHGSPDAILLDASGSERGFNVWDRPAAITRAAIAAHVAAERPRLVELSRRYKEHDVGDGGFAVGELAGEALVAFAQIGWELHEDLFGLPASETETAKVGQAIARSARSAGGKAVLEIEDRIGVPIPWGVVYDARAYAAALKADGAPGGERYVYPRTPADVDLASFWGYRFATYRTIVQRPDVPSTAVAEGGPDDLVAVTAVLNPALDADVIDRQRALFASPQAEGSERFVADVTISDRQSFVQWVHDGRDSACDLLYFFCHAMAPSEFGAAGHPTGASSELAASLGFGGEQDQDAFATLRDLRIEWGELRHRRPVVMLNACGSTQTDAIYGAPFVNYVLRDWRGRALVGTDWTVPTRFADAFSRAVMTELRTGAQLLVAIRGASMKAFEQGNPYPLIYSLYGQPNVHFSRRPTGG